MARSGQKAAGMNPIANTMRYSGAYTPKGVQALNKGKTRSSDMGPKKFKSFHGGEMYKDAPTMRSIGSHRDMSSGEVGPTKQARSDKDRYEGEKQPTQYSNAVGPQPTKFIC